MAHGYDFRKGGQGTKPAKKELSELRIRKAENGGHVVEHQFSSGGELGMYNEPELHSFGPGDGKAMLSHVAKHMGIEEGEGEDRGEYE